MSLVAINTRCTKVQFADWFYTHPKPQTSVRQNAESEPDGSCRASSDIYQKRLANWSKEWLPSFDKNAAERGFPNLASLVSSFGRSIFKGNLERLCVLQSDHQYDQRSEDGHTRWTSTIRTQSSPTRSLIVLPSNVRSHCNQWSIYRLRITSSYCQSLWTTKSRMQLLLLFPFQG